MHEFIRRLLGTVVAVGILVGILAFSYVPVMKWVICAVAISLSAIAIWEYCQLANKKGVKTATSLLAIAAGCIVFAFFLPTQWGFVSLYLPLLVLMVSFFAICFVHFSHISGSITGVAVSLFPLLYIAVPVGMLIAILLGLSQGLAWFIYIVLVTKVTDIGAYVGGKLLGKHPLAPHISPKKTMEGALIGLLCAVGASFLSAKFFLPLPPAQSLSLGIVLGVMGQCGDLSESLLKRDAHTKDSNKIPGLGGVLDLLDSLLFNIPIIFIYLML